MTWILAGILGVHGLIHLMGFAKAFGYAALPQLTRPISRGWGVAWLIAAALVTASAVTFAIGARRFWLIGVIAVLVSQVVIVSAWGDAWAGTIANVILLALAVHGWLTEGPLGFHAQFQKDAEAGLARPLATAAISEADLAPLPAPVQQYLRLVGVVGQPRVQNYRLRFRGRIRSGPASRWMPFEAEQQSFADQPTRLFLTRARMFGVPMEAFHRSVDGHATMQVKIAGLAQIVDARGDEMDRAEAVTLFNDMCLLAPGTLVDRRIAWEPVDTRSARARFTHGGHTVSATLQFSDDGLLSDFVSDDRSRSADGKTFERLRFSTPVRAYRAYGPVRVAAHGEARWHPPEGAFTYGEFELIDVALNLRP
jgi:hypothetical protein